MSYLSEGNRAATWQYRRRQQAALYIADAIFRRSRPRSEIEDFTISSNTETPSLICAGILLVAVVLGLVVPAIGILAFLLAW